MPDIKTILHVEDMGEDRRNFIRDVVPDECFKVVHLNPPEELIGLDEALERISKKVNEIDFIVVDLAMSQSQHARFDKYFDEGSLPAEPREEEDLGGLGLIHRLITKLKFNPDKIAILTQHLPTGGAFRDINQVSRIWWNVVIKTFYKRRAADFRDLRKMICQECGISAEQPDSTEGRAKNGVFASGLESVLCVSDVEWFRTSVKNAIETYNQENSDGKNIEISLFSDIDEATGFFKGKEKDDPCLYVVDITANEKENDTLKAACNDGDEQMEKVLYELKGVALINHIQFRNKNASFIVVTNCGHQPGLVRWFMDLDKVKFVIDISDFKMNLVSAVWSFMHPS